MGIHQECDSPSERKYTYKHRACIRFQKAAEALVWVSGEELMPSGQQQPRRKPVAVRRVHVARS